MAEWWNVNKTVQVWAGHAENQKQGRLVPAAGVEILEQYKGSGRFDPDEVRFEGNGHWEEFKDNPSYPEYWVQMDLLSKTPFIPSPDPTPFPDPDPVPDPVPVPGDEPSDAEIGRVVRFLFGR